MATDTVEMSDDLQQTSTSVTESVEDASATNITSNESLETAKNGRVDEEGPHMIHLRQALHKTIKKCIGAAR